MPHLRTHRSGLVLPALLCATALTAQCANNLFVNGDLNGAVGEDIVASGWYTALSSPDLNDANGDVHTTVCFHWIGTPLDSPTGGPWQNVTGTESFLQGVPTTVGNTYRVCWDYARQPIVCGGSLYDDPFAVLLRVDGIPIFTTPEAQEPYLWQHACTTFEATEAVTSFEFEGSGVQTYGGIDGLCLQADATASIGGGPTMVATQLFPNPATDRTQLRMGKALAAAWATNSAGQVFTLVVEGATIDVHTLAAGLYAVHSRPVDGSVPIMVRLLVQR